MSDSLDCCIVGLYQRSSSNGIEDSGAVIRDCQLHVDSYGWKMATRGCLNCCTRHGRWEYGIRHRGQGRQDPLGYVCLRILQCSHTVVVLARISPRNTPSLRGSALISCDRENLDTLHLPVK